MKEVLASRKLKIGLFIIMLAVVALSMLGAGIAVQQSLKTLQLNLINELIYQSKVIAVSTKPAFVAADQQSAAKSLSMLRANPNIMAAFITTKDGHTLARYSHKGVTNSVGEKEMEQDLLNVFINNIQLDKPIYTSLDDMLIVVQPILEQDKLIGIVYLQSAVSGIYSDLNKNILLAAIVSLLSFILLMLLILRLDLRK